MNEKRTTRRITSATFLFCVLQVGCESPPTTSSATASTTAAKSSSGAKSATAAPSASAPASASAAAAKPAPGKKEFSASEKAAIVKHLTEGRKLAQKKEYKAAIAAFEKALAVSPKDARVLAELGWAAFHDKDLARAEAANKSALAATGEPKLRAQILYNTGRVAEEKNDKEAARKAYEASLVLRDNAEVAKRFTSMGGDPDSVRRAWTTCSEGFASVDALCGCLKKNAETLLSFADGDVKCVADPSVTKPKLPDARLSVVRLSNETGSATTAILVAKDGKDYRAVASLGEDFEPGAFGVHNTVELKDGEVKQVGGRSIAIVKHRDSHADFNMAGLELCSYEVEFHELCVLGDGTKPTACPRSIPVSTEDACGVGVELEGEVDPGTQETVNEIKKNAFSHKATVSYTIDEKGQVVAKLEGDASLVQKSTLGTFSLF